MDRLEQKARDFSLNAHGDQMYGKLPYEFHLNAVVALLPDDPSASTPHQLGNASRMRSAAWLHDVVEDTPVTLFDVRREFGGHIAAIVDACTDPEDQRLSRNEKKAIVYKKLRASKWDARRVKLADRIANMQASVENPKMAIRYMNEFPDFIRAIDIGDNCNRTLIIKAYNLYMNAVTSHGQTPT